MKVTINSNNAPFSDGFFSGAGGGLIGGLFSLAGAGIDAAVKNKQQQKQMQHDKDMAALNQQNTFAQMAQSQAYNEQNMATQQEYNLSTMAQQNQYQLDQWNRENVYNDPSAVAERYRSAGINPRAVMNGAASGAGIAGGLSTAPSGGAPSSSAPSGSNTGSASNIMYGTSFASLGSDYLAGARLQAQNKRDLAEAKLKEEQAESEIYERTFIKPHTARLQSALADKGVSEATIKSIEAQWAPYMADLKSRIMEGTINEQIQRIAESAQRIIESKAVTGLKEEEQNLVKQQIEESKERAIGYAYERAYKRALTDLTGKQLLNVQMDTALKDAQKGHYDKLKDQVQKEIEYLGKKMLLTDQQIKKWKNDIALGWAKYGASVAQATSQEIRNWMFGFIPGVKQSSTNFYSDDVPMFAD